MHPNSFLKTLWRNEIRNQIFVAMSFEDRFTERFEKVIKPAIENKKIENFSLKAHRVDNSKTGDSILTEIVDGIAHSRLVLADVSVIDEGRYSESPIRNGNVMYEVGIALASRSPSEVLLIRDDSKKFLFDISTIPHITIDFLDIEKAISILQEAIADRLKETNLLHDARVKIAAKSVTSYEFEILKSLYSLAKGRARCFEANGVLSISTEKGLSGLMSKGLIEPVGRNSENGIFYVATAFGRALYNYHEKYLPKLEIIQTENL